MKILACCTRWSCTWCPEGLFENSKCLWGSVCCGQLHSLKSTLWRSNQQKQINASASVSPLLLILSKFSRTEKLTQTSSFHIWIGCHLIFLWMVPLAKEVERTSSDYWWTPLLTLISYSSVATFISCYETSIYKRLYLFTIASRAAMYAAKRYLWLKPT